MSNSLVNPGSDPDRSLPSAEERRRDSSSYRSDEGMAPPPMPPIDFGEDDDGGFDPRRLLSALRRYWWLVVLATGLGVAGAAFAWGRVSLQYTATGSLWVDSGRRSTNPGDVLPIRQSGLFGTSAYIDLIRSLSVLLPVVDEQQLYLGVRREWRPLFETLSLAEGFEPGSYALEIDASGSGWTLSREGVGEVERGAPGDSIGTGVGFEFAPPASALPAGERIEFRVIEPHEAARILGNALTTSMDREGSFIRVNYGGTDPVRIAGILNAVLERHIEVAAELKRNQLDETLEVLEEQLVYTQSLLTDAEREFQDFQVRTITLPSDQASGLVPGLEMTRDPVFDNYFDMQIDLERLRDDRDRLQEILESLPDTVVPVEALEAIPVASTSRELQPVLDELVELRSDIRALRFRYSDEYPPIQEALARVNVLTSDVIPGILRGLLQELNQREDRLTGRMASAGSELSEIPTRTIEEARLRRRVEIQETLYNDLRSRVENARLAANSSVPDVRILDRAVVPSQPSQDPRILLAGLFLLGGFGAGLVGAVVVDLLDGRLRYPKQIDDELGLSVLGSIPRIRGRGRKKAEAEASVLEAFRELRIAIGFAFGSAGPVTLVITSPSENEGKTFISANTAVAFADMGKRTLLIDGDTRRGDAHRVLGLSRTPGLSDFLQGHSAGEIIQPTSYPNLDFIGCGTRSPHTPELLASKAMVDALGSLKRSYDVIIIDSPPLSGGGDALVLSSLTGNVAVVLRSGSTGKALAAAKIERLSRYPLRVLGAILNDIEPDGLYGYYPNYLPSYLTDVEVEGHGGAAGRKLVSPGSAKNRSGKPDDD